MDDQFEVLTTLGSRIQFFVQRMMYLRQHPDARPSQPFLWNDETALTSSLVTGALFDLLIDISEGAIDDADFRAKLTETGVDLHLTARHAPDESRPGYRFMRLVATSMRFDQEQQCLTISASGTSIEAGFPAWKGAGCPPAIAR